MPAVTVKQSQLVKLFLALGVDTATEWPLKKLKEKAEAGLKKFVPPGEEVADDELRQLFDAIEAANKDQDAITVEADAPAPEGKKSPDPKKPAANGAAKSKPGSAATSGAASSGSKGSPSSTKPDPKKPAAAPAKPEPKPKPKPQKRGGWQPGDPPLAFDLNRGPGVIYSLVELLKKANADKPLTKEAAVEKLHAKFPDRDKLQLTTTVNNQMPSRLRIVRGIHLHKDGKGGYWIEGEGDKPQQNPPKTKNTPPAPKPKAQPLPKAAKKVMETTYDKPKPSPEAKPAPKKPAAKPAPAKPAAKKKPSK